MFRLPLLVNHLHARQIYLTEWRYVRHDYSQFERHFLSEFPQGFRGYGEILQIAGRSHPSQDRRNGTFPLNLAHPFISSRCIFVLIYACRDMTDRGIQRSNFFYQIPISANDHVCELHQLCKLLGIAKKHRVIQIDHQSLTGFLEPLFHVNRRIVEDLTINEHRVITLQLCPQPVPPTNAAFQQLARAKTHPRKVVILLWKAVGNDRSMPVLAKMSEVWQNAKSRRRYPIAR